MSASFEAPLKEMARTIKCVQTTMADRAAAMGQFCQVCVWGGGEWAGEWAGGWVGWRMGESGG